MKKAGIWFVTVALLLAGCGGGASQPSQSPLPVELPETEPEVQMLELFFSSGAGAWSTEITLQPDGSFTGFYSDADMGSSGEGYPNGTVYLCGFEGEFSEKVPRDEYSWSMTLESLTHDYEEGKEWIEDGVRYVSSEPYGMEQGTEFVLYRPETPSEGLNEEFWSWWPFRGNDSPETLELYGLWNVEMGYGFFG